MPLEVMERRLQIRGSLTEWARHCDYEPAKHHRLILDALKQLSYLPVTLDGLGQRQYFKLSLALRVTNH